MSIKTLHLLLLTCCLTFATSARILGIMTTSVKSMNNFMHSIFEELARRGHDLTVISSVVRHDVNYRVIKMDYYEFMSLRKGLKNDTIPSGSFIEYMSLLRNTMLKLTELTLNSSSVQEFINGDSSNFDAVICEEFYAQAFYMFAHKYQAPLILVRTFGHSQYTNNFMGNPLELSFEPQEILKFHDDMNFWQRMKNVLAVWWDIYAGLKNLEEHDRIAKNFFENSTKTLPSLRTIEKNASLVLVNAHIALTNARPIVPSVVPVAGLHIKKSKLLPNDLSAIVDGSQNGVIYFSLGSMMKSSDIPREKINVFLEVFSKLKQTVLWKWEEDDLPGKPENVVLRKWMPQNDILAHPKVRLFISHGGLLSMQEAIYHGVPFVGMPLFADHFRNMAVAKHLGISEEIDLHTLNYTELQTTINKVLKNDKYKTKIEELSKRFKDTPLSAMDNAVFWIEYVIRHRGAKHLKPPSVWMSWFDYYLIDVGVVLFSAVILVCINVWIVIKLLFNIFTRLQRRRYMGYVKNKNY